MGIPDSEDHPELIRKDYPPNDCQPHSRFVAFCDVLGFSLLVHEQSVESIAVKYDSMLREAEASCLMVKSYPSPTPWIAERYRAGSTVFSDSILLWSSSINESDKPRLDDTGYFFPYVAGVFSIGMKMGFPLRIGIAYGNCVINAEANLFVGLPIIHAYQTEQAQDWIGVACHTSCFDSPRSQDLCMEYLNGWQCGPLIEYEIPIKDSFRDVVSTKHSIDWPFWGQSDWGSTNTLESIIRERIKQYTGNPHILRWERALKYYLFRISKWTDIKDKSF